MKKKIALSFFIIIVTFSWAQKKQNFNYSNSPLISVILDVEKTFNVKYSYLDSLVVSQKISLPKKSYSLEEINSQIEQQSNLKVIKISDRFYSLTKLTASTTDENEIALKEVIVEEFLAKGIKKINQFYVLSPQKVQTLPGITDADILQSLQQLPGVKSPNETATGLHIRGGSADQNLILMDGIRLYHPGHLFGMISSINPNVEQTVNYVNKGANPKYGERISSVIDIKSTDKVSDITKVNAGINALNADIYFKTPLVKNKIGLQLSGRKSITEWWRSPTFNQLERKVFQNTNFREFNNDNQFKFIDYSAKIVFEPNDKTLVSVSGLRIKNDLDYRNIAKNDSIRNQRMNIENYGFSMNWTQKYSSKLIQKALVYYSLYNFDYLRRTDFQINRFEAYSKLNRIIDSGVTLDYEYQITDKAFLDFGYQFLGNDVSHLFNSFTQNIGVILNSNQNYNTTHIGFINIKNEVKSWIFQPGLRFNYFKQISKARIEPRLFIQKTFSESVIIQATYESRNQILSQVREDVASDLSLENYVWILSDNRDYPIQKANQYSTGLLFKKNSWLLDVDLYYKDISGITSFTLGFLGQNSNTINIGKGFTKGIDVMLQKNSKTSRFWITYTYQDSQIQFDEINQGNYFKSNANMEHSLNLAYNRKWKHFLFTAGWFFRTGKPFSTIDESGQIITYNSQELPNYHRLDISGSYQFVMKGSSVLKIGASIYNLYNRNVLISREQVRNYSTVADFITPRYTEQDFYSLGIMPNVFVRVNF